jgi:hypothetical protein
MPQTPQGERSGQQQGSVEKKLGGKELSLTLGSEGAAVD